MQLITAVIIIYFTIYITAYEVIYAKPRLNIKVTNIFVLI